MSVASLVLGIAGIPLCMLFIPSVLAVVFGFVGLGQIRRDSSQTGRGLAVAGIVLGLVMLALLALGIAFGDTDLTIES